MYVPLQLPTFEFRKRRLFRAFATIRLLDSPSNYARASSPFHTFKKGSTFHCYFRSTPTWEEGLLFESFWGFCGKYEYLDREKNGIIFDYDLEGNYILDSTIETLVLTDRLDKMKLKRGKIGKNGKPFLFVRLDTETYYRCPDEVQQSLTDLTISDKSLVSKVKIYPWCIGGHAKTDFEIPYYEEKGVEKIWENGYKNFMERNIEGSRKYTVVGIFHNTQYDIEQAYFILNKWGFKVLTKLRTGKYIPSMLSGILVRGETEIQLLDTFFMYNNSLETAAGMKKQNVPYSLVNPEFNVEKDTIYYSLWGSMKRHSFPLSLYLSYLEEDVAAVDKLFTRGIKYGSFISRKLNRTLSPNEYLTKSQAGISRTFVKELFDQNGWEKFSTVFRFPITKEEDLICSNSSRGGLTGYNKNYPLGVICEEGTSIGKFDITSSYPYIYQRGLPGSGNEKLMYDEVPPSEKREEGILFYHVEFISSNIPALKREYAHAVGPILFPPGFTPQSKRNRRGETVENKKGTPTINHVFICEEYYDKLCELYINFSDSHIIHRKMYMKRRYELGKITEILGKEKNEIDAIRRSNMVSDEKKEELKHDRDFIKIVMNSVYGICGKRTFYDPEYYRTEPLYERDDYSFSIKGEGNILFSNRENKEAESRFAGIYVAQVGRVRILELLIEFGQIGYPTPLYWDTDSISLLSRNEDFESGRTKYFPSTAEIGGGSLEGRFKALHLFDGCKKYIFIPADGEGEQAIEKAIAFGGIGGGKKAIINMLKHSPEKVEQLISIMRNRKPIFLAVKNRKVSTGTALQKILGPIDVKLYTKEIPDCGVAFKLDENNNSYFLTDTIDYSKEVHLK